MRGEAFVVFMKNTNLEKPIGVFTLYPKQIIRT